MGGPMIQPAPLQDCARLMRVAAYRSGPSTVVYGFAMVSRNVRPVAMTQTPARKPMNAVVGVTLPWRTRELMWVAGMNQNPPIATMARPMMMPRLYPDRKSAAEG